MDLGWRVWYLQGMPEIQLYEAIVTDAAPDASLPGHIKVQIPELFEDVELPISIPPLFPGWTAGGWQSIPSVDNPDGGDSRVIVIRLGNQSFRWIGTGQADAFISDNPGTRAGARSGDGRHRIWIDDTDGFFAQVASDSEAPSNYININPDDTIRMQTADGTTLAMTETQFVAINASGDALILDSDNGVSLTHQGGVANLSLRSGDVAALSGSAVQINGGTIEMGGGVIPPIHGYILSLTFLADLALLAADVVAAGAAIPSMSPYVATNATNMIAKIATSLSAGAPYLSTRISGD